MKWISVKDKKPRANKKVLFYVDGKMCEGYRYTHLNEDKYNYEVIEDVCHAATMCRCSEPKIPTHYMLLPDKP